MDYISSYDGTTMDTKSRPTPLNLKTKNIVHDVKN